MMEQEIRFDVFGKVQGVFFRKSFVYWIQTLGLKGGATNNIQNPNLVHCTVVTDASTFSEISKKLLEGPFNNIGAYVKEIYEADHGIDWEDHQAKTENGELKLPMGVRLKVKT